MPRETSKTKISTFSTLFLAFAIILTLSACGGGNGGNATVLSVTITPASANVN